MNVRKYIWNTDLHQPETNLESIRLELKCCIYLTRTSSNKDVCVNTAFGSILAFLQFMTLNRISWNVGSLLQAQQ